jgi:hypothetical protein
MTARRERPPRVRRRGRSDDADTTGPWTLAEGIRDLVAVLLRRLPLGIVVWAVLLVGYRAWVGQLVAIGEDTDRAVKLTFDTSIWSSSWRRSGSLLLIVASAGGVTLGAWFARHLVEAVRFSGAIPRLFAIGAVAVAILAATALALPAFPAGFLPVLLLLGAAAVVSASLTVLLLTWAD